MNNAICYFFSYTVEAIILLQYTSNLFVPRYSSKKLFALISLYFTLFIVALFEQTWLNAVMFLGANFIFIITQYNIKWHLALLHSSLITAIMGMCELIVYGIISDFTPNFFSAPPKTYFYNLAIITIFSKIMYFTILYILIHIFKEKQKSKQQYDRTTFVLVLIPITSIFVMLTLISIGEIAALTPFLAWMITLSAVFLLAINLLVFAINQYNRRKNIEFTDMQLLLQKESDSVEYYKMLLEQHENQSILIHDIKKHLQSIALLNDQKQYDKITTYIKQLLLSSELTESYRLCDYELLNAILCRYQRKCDQQHISFHTDIRSGTVDFLSENDSTSLFCNLLDNALAAAARVPEAFIEIHAEKRDKTSMIVITVINSCRTDPFIGQDKKLITHKSDKAKHGFGIKSIRKIVHKYNGNMEMYYDDTTSTFHTIIALRG
ncbi:MAG: GHKL domain-containing protein [Acetatifactor sp.]|nr:GHKL domain-containing protein [Acetatifactor sp.]